MTKGGGGAGGRAEKGMLPGAGKEGLARGRTQRGCGAPPLPPWQRIAPGSPASPAPGVTTEGMRGRASPTEVIPVAREREPGTNGLLSGCLSHLIFPGVIPGEHRETRMWTAP